MKFKIALFFVVIIGTGVGLQAQNQTKLKEQSLVWKMHQPGKVDTSYLLGTIHIPVKKVFHAIDTVNGLIKLVDQVYFELEYDPFAFAKQSMFFMAKEDSQKLKNILPAEKYDLLHERVAAQLGEQALMIDFLNPLGIISLLTSSMAPSDTNGVMDFLLQEEAKKQEKKTGGLETIESQMELLFSLTLAEQKKELIDLIDNYEDYVLQFDTLIQAYVNHDLLLIKKMVNQSFSACSDLLKEELLVKRNRKMAIKIEELSSKKKSLFGVGAAHLVGENGIIQLLEKKGFVLTPIVKSNSGK